MEVDAGPLLLADDVREEMYDGARPAYAPVFEGKSVGKRGSGGWRAVGPSQGGSMSAGASDGRNEKARMSLMLASS
jgi:hypothetical protein